MRLSAYGEVGIKIICNDGSSIDVREYERLSHDEGGIKVTLNDGSSIDVREYERLSIDGLDGDLADGATFTFPDGCTVTRRGDEAVWRASAKG